MITIVTQSDKYSAGANPARDGDGSTVIMEDGELAFPSGPSMRGAVAKKTSDGVQKFRNFSKTASKTASKIASVNEAIKENNGNATINNTESNSSGTKAVDITGVPDRKMEGTDTLNGVERTMIVKKSGDTIRIKRPIKE